jgi:Spy/CpxP family protein refolding chaperone
VNLGRLNLVVLATVVIFAAGVVTGSLIVKKTSRPQITQPFWGRFEMTRRAIEELDRQGDLTPKQRARIDHIIQGSQELIADYWSILEPDVQEVFRKMREGIREELTPDQRQRFEEMARRRLNRSGERRPPFQQFRDGPDQPGPFPRDGNEPRPPRSGERPPPFPSDRPPPDQRDP